jgi:hypothetical protein
MVGRQTVICSINDGLVLVSSQPTETSKNKILLLGRVAAMHCDSSDLVSGENNAETDRQL